MWVVGGILSAASLGVFGFEACSFASVRADSRRVVTRVNVSLSSCYGLVGRRYMGNEGKERTCSGVMLR